MQELADTINSAFTASDPSFAKTAIAQAIAGLSDGSLRIAQKHAQTWAINEWLKKAILLHFKLSKNTLMSSNLSNFYDKVGLKYTDYSLEQFQEQAARIVPPAHVREGAYIAPNCVIMPSYVNIGAYVDSGSMIDIWATIGSCAQIGKNTHISSNTCIGGVLEPIQANPVIIEDNCFVGTGCAIVEGVIVEAGSVIAMGTKIGQSTKIYDARTGQIYYGRIPAGSVVIPGSLPAADNKYHSQCAIIIKTVDAATRAKVSINELLRD